MSDIVELWSLPWRDLQRSLAAEFGRQTHAATAGNSSSATMNVCRPGSSACVGSWLLRARAAGGRCVALPKTNCRITARQASYCVHGKP